MDPFTIQSFVPELSCTRAAVRSSLNVHIKDFARGTFFTLFCQHFSLKKKKKRIYDYLVHLKNLFPCRSYWMKLNRFTVTIFYILRLFLRGDVCVINYWLSVKFHVYVRSVCLHSLISYQLHQASSFFILFIGKPGP